MCGQTFSNRSVSKIVGGVEAIPGSWPSIAYIVWNYKTDYVPQGETLPQTVWYNSFMAGTLIDTRRILTTASSIYTSRKVTYKNVSYTINVVANNYYPTLASMFTVYLGVQNVSTLASTYPVYAKPVIKMNVLNFSKVNLKHFIVKSFL